jgi:hypothetical protein
MNANKKADQFLDRPYLVRWRCLHAFLVAFFEDFRDRLFPINIQ